MCAQPSRRTRRRSRQQAPSCQQSASLRARKPPPHRPKLLQQCMHSRPSSSHTGSASEQGLVPGASWHHAPGTMHPARLTSDVDIGFESSDAALDHEPRARHAASLTHTQPLSDACAPGARVSSAPQPRHGGSWRLMDRGFWDHKRKEASWRRQAAAWAANRGPVSGASSCVRGASVSV